MEHIKRKITVGTSRETAFDKFVNYLNDWWPKEYTWSGQKLKEIAIEPRVGGMCFETGPYGFHCNWGRVTGYREGEWIELTWQISPKRVPEPDPQKASRISVNFIAHSPSETLVDFEHSDFSNHGDGSDEYLKAMDSESGWDYIFQKYAEFC
jgi:hypothetical protein